MSSSPAPAIELRGISKRFGELQANADISLSAARGSVHAIVGENGAGKSTAMKMLYGLYQPDSGEVLVDGVAWGGRGHKWRSPSDAIACGIGMVHQHFMLAEPYSALENVVLGAETAVAGTRFLPRALRPIDFSGARERLKQMSARYGLHVDWDKPVDELPVGVQQRIEILKLLYREARVLILDEPTAVLTPQETEGLFDNLRKLKAQGKTILIITHKLKEVMALADDVTVFRAGRVTASLRTAETSPSQLADKMVGRKVNLEVQAPDQPPLGDVALELKQVSLRSQDASHAGLMELQDISFAVRAGEIVGIAGIEGNGQSQLLQLIQRPEEYARRATGTVSVLGRKTLGPGTKFSAAEIKTLGVGIVPEDRHRQGLLLERTVADNFLLGLQRCASFSSLRGRWIDRRALVGAVGRALEEYDVRPRELSAIAGRLSGGNQQKLVIAREFERKPGLFMAAQPTRGVDVGAIEFIHRRIFKARDEGAGVLLVSSELEEVLTLSDRILVMYGGRVVAQFNRGEADERALGLAMGGAQGGAS
jgi:general nucleoside transport system ATP-binding protein